NLGMVALTVIAMEAWAWFSHKYILHGPFWFLHKTHHEPQTSWWEWNDLVSILYGIFSAALIFMGRNDFSWPLWVGIGIAVYGIFYFIFHDIIIHRRVKIKYTFNSSYVNRLIRAHKMHHKHLQKEDSEAFGFLYADRKYEVKRVQKSPSSQR
ncbi:MAG: sterol desaturase family protein, partial [Bacteroidota bacterium]